MTGVPPYRRPVNMMFQSYALFPHMDVAANVGYGLRRDGVKGPEIADRVAEILTARASAGPCEAQAGAALRRPASAGGTGAGAGEAAQAAAARRALAALDRKLREGTRFELVRLQEQLGLTFVMVTHDQEEAMSMATRLAVMNAGRIAQIGTPHEVYEHPASRFVADFIGIANIIALDGGGWMALRPEKITLSATRLALPQTVAGRIVDVAYEGDRSLYHVETDAHGTMTVSTTNTSRSAGDAFCRGRAGLAGWADEAGQRLEA